MYQLRAADVVNLCGLCCTTKGFARSMVHKTAVGRQCCSTPQQEAWIVWLCWVTRLLKIYAKSVSQPVPWQCCLQQRLDFTTRRLAGVSWGDLL
jgi:hypothetical protein